jgi:hypothetical protein
MLCTVRYESLIEVIDYGKVHPLNCELWNELNGWFHYFDTNWQIERSKSKEFRFCFHIFTHINI